MKRPRSATDQLDQALDAAISGDASALFVHDAEAAQTWHLLTEWAELGGMDGLEPLPATPSILDEDVIHTHERPVIMPHANAFPPPAIVPPPVTTSPRRHPWGVAASALAWLLIVAIGGGAIWGLWPILRDRNPEPTPLTALQPDASSEATPALDPDPNLVANWAGEGHSWNMSPEDPILGDPTILATLGTGGERLLSRPLVVGDSVYLSLSGQDGTPIGGRTLRFDLVRREIVWESPAVLSGSLSANGMSLVGEGILLDANSVPARPEPVELSLATGEVLDTHLDTRGADPMGPTVVDAYSMLGETYWIGASGTVTVTSGIRNIPTELGSTRITVLGTLDLPESSRGNIRSVSITASAEYVFAVRPSMTVVQFDRGTGEELNSINLVDSLQRDIVGATLQARNGNLIVTASVSYSAGAEVYPSIILVLDEATFEPITGASIYDLRSAPVVDDNGIYFSGRLEPRGAVLLFRMDAATGTVSAPLGDYEADPLEYVRLSIAGDTLLVANSNGTVSAMNIQTDAIFDSLTLPLSPNEGGYMVGPVLIWNSYPLVVTANGTIIMLGAED